MAAPAPEEEALGGDLSALLGGAAAAPAPQPAASGLEALLGGMQQEQPAAQFETPAFLAPQAAAAAPAPEEAASDETALISKLLGAGLV